MEGIGNINCDDCPCETCSNCEDNKRPNTVYLTAANFVNEERFMATECDSPENGCGDIEETKACLTVAPLANFNGTHELAWVSTAKINSELCRHIYEGGPFDLGDIYDGPYFCQDCIPPGSLVDVLGNPLWKYDLQYRFRLVVDDLNVPGVGTPLNFTLYGIDADGNALSTIATGTDVSRTWFCSSGVSYDAHTFTNGTSNMIPLFNGDGPAFPPSTRGYWINTLDVECGTAGTAAKFTFSSSVARTAA